MPRRFGTERDAAGMQGVAFLAASVLQGGVVDAAVLEEAVLDVLVDRHDAFDVFQVIEPMAVGHLVEGADGDQVGGGRGRHGPPCRRRVLGQSPPW